MGDEEREMQRNRKKTILTQSRKDRKGKELMNYKYTGETIENNPGGKLKCLDIHLIKGNEYEMVRQKDLEEVGYFKDEDGDIKRVPMNVMELAER